MPRGRYHVDVEVLGGTTVHSNRPASSMQGETSKLRAARCRGGQVLLYSTRRLRLAIRNTHPPRRTLPASGQPTNGVGGSEPITAGHRALMTHSLVTRPPPVTPLAAGDQHAGIELWQRARAAIAKGSVAYSPIKRLPTTDAIASHRIDRPGDGSGIESGTRACGGASTHGPMGSLPEPDTAAARPAHLSPCWSFDLLVRLPSMSKGMYCTAASAERQTRRGAAARRRSHRRTRTLSRHC